MRALNPCTGTLWFAQSGQSGVNPFYRAGLSGRVPDFPAFDISGVGGMDHSQYRANKNHAIRHDRKTFQYTGFGFIAILPLNRCFGFVEGERPALPCVAVPGMALGSV